MYKRQGEYFKSEYGADFVFVTHYPSKKRPFYAMDDPENKEFTLSFDLLFRGLEITTGGQRIHDYETLLKKIAEKGMDIEGMEDYLDCFKYGMPPHGGLGICLLYTSNPTSEVTIALVGKYIQLHDAYLSVMEALKHGGIANRTKVSIKWVDSEFLTPEILDDTFAGVDGIIIPGGFGSRGTEGMILAANYARENKIPFLGICLGMQMAMVAFARNVLGYEDANSSELNPDTTHPVVDLMPDQNGIENLGGTLRLGSYPCVLDKKSKAYALSLIHI